MREKRRRKSTYIKLNEKEKVKIRGGQFTSFVALAKVRGGFEISIVLPYLTSDDSASLPRPLFSTQTHQFFSSAVRT